MKFRSTPARPFSWSELKLADVCKTFTSGGTPSRKKPEYFKNGTIPWVRSKELNDGVIVEVEEYITADALQNSSAKILPKDTDLLAMYGATVGKLGILGFASSCNQACAAMVPKDGIADYRFLYYLLLNHRETIISQATGGAQQNLSGELIKKFTFDFPSYLEQQAIADVLWKLDSKLTANNALSKTLEDIAQTVFKSWFIDFDPVKAKMAGEQPVGMNAETAALFPDSMEESELGLIPRGWAESFLSEISAISKISINPQKYLDTDFIHYSIPAFDSGSSPIKVSGSHVLSNKFVLDSNAVLVSKLNPQTTRIWTVLDPVVSSVCSTEFIVLVPKEECYLSFLNATVRDPYFLDTLVSMATGSTGSRQRIRPEEVFQIGIALPSLELIVRFHAIAMPIIKKLQVIREENQALSKLRDSLLPRLISGELQIPDEMLAS